MLRTLQTLIRRGMVELRADTTTPEPPAGGLFGAALAALFVHGSGIEMSVDALRRAIEQVGALPRARCFHLLLDEKGSENVAALCGRLALFDDRNVLAVSPDHPRNAGPALRDLLARWLP